MVMLSEAQVKGKTKVDRLEDVKNLNVCGQGIDDVSILQQAPNIEVLSMSVNKISSLRHFAFCSQLKQLYLRANGVTDLAEVRYLMGLQHLRVLWLADNPCTKLPYYRAVVVANLPNLENLDNVAVNDADRQAAKGIRQLQPATAADVLAEDQEAAAAAAAQEAELQPASDTLQHSGVPPGQGAVLPPHVSSREGRGQHHQALPHITSPRQSASATSVPLTAAGAAVAAAGLPRRGSAQPARSAPSPEPTDMLDSADSMEQGGRPSSARTGYTTPAAVTAAPSVTGSYRASPEPPADSGLQQQGRGGYSMTVTPRDMGRASSTGLGITPGHQGEADTARQLYGEHSFGSLTPARPLPQHQQHYQPHQHQQQHHYQQQEQCKPWPSPVGSEQAGYQHYNPSSPCCPPLKQQQVLVWRPPEGAAAGHYPPGSSVAAPAGSRTNVLYAVMALLGELDVSGLSIVQREVQMRLMEQQQ